MKLNAQDDRSQRSEWRNGLEGIRVDGEMGRRGFVSDGENGFDAGALG